MLTYIKKESRYSSLLFYRYARSISFTSTPSILAVAFLKSVYST